MYIKTEGRIIMPVQVSQEAVNRLCREIAAKDSHGVDTINRLKNENPGYVIVGKPYLEIIQSKFGKEARELALEMTAACYRVLELSERYPDRTKELVEEQRIAKILLADPSLDEQNANIDNARKETTATLNKYMLHTEK